MERINEAKSWFFEKISKTNKHLSKLIKRQKEKIQIKKIRNEKEDITDNEKIKRIITYFKDLYSITLKNLKVVGNIHLDRYYIPKLKQQTKPNPGLDGFSAEL